MFGLVRSFFDISVNCFDKNLQTDYDIYIEMRLLFLFFLKWANQSINAHCNDVKIGREFLQGREFCPPPSKIACENATFSTALSW